MKKGIDLSYEKKALSEYWKHKKAILRQRKLFKIERRRIFQALKNRGYQVTKIAKIFRVTRVTIHQSLRGRQ